MKSASLGLSYQIPRTSLAWILLSVALVLIPQWSRLPVVVSVIGFLCIAWRLLIHLGKVNYPGRGLRIAVVVLTLVIAVWQLRLLGVGLDAAVSLLALGFVFKLIEMRSKRDLYVVVSLCFLLCMVSFIYSQSILTTLYILTVITVMTAAMISLNRSSPAIASMHTLGLAGKIVLQAIPLTAVLFVVFPRIAPLWSVPLQNAAARSGVSDEMSPGDISSLGRSGELAFRATFADDETPPHEDLYWRGLVLDNFDGVTWSRQRRPSFLFASDQYQRFSENENRTQRQGQALEYNITLEATQQPWLFGLHLAEVVSPNIFGNTHFELFNNGLISQRLSYDLQSYTESRTDLGLPEALIQRNLGLPQNGNEQARGFARRLHAQSNNDKAFADSVLNYFGEQTFYYTLNPSLLTGDRIDQFLFESREGFCEHYASAFTFLMRAAGIPARVVVGYQGAEHNHFENYLMVYQYNAHAWSELWLEGEGWVRYDPTAAVSPERIRIGVEAALADDPAFMEEALFSAARIGGSAWLNQLRLRLDALEYEWNRRVVNYDEQKQYDLFTNLFGQVSTVKVLSLLSGATFLVVLIVGLTIIRNKPALKRNLLNQLYRRFCVELSEAGLPRNNGEGPLDYCARASGVYPSHAEELQSITQLYINLGYRSWDAGRDDNESENARRMLKQKIANLKLPKVKQSGV